MAENGGSVSVKDQLFGKIALKNKLVSETQLKECLAIVGETANGDDLAAVLLHKGYIGEKHAGAIRSKVDSMGDKKGDGNHK